MPPGPLDGVRVLEFSQIIAGPMGCQLLADLGAEVIKVEPPGGEPWRLYSQYVPLESKVFQALNRGKKSLAIDVTRPEAQQAIHRLVPFIDVVVINYRPDVAQRLHIDYESLSAIRSDLIYVDNTAFGREGPLAGRPGYDIVVQAMAGLIASVGKVNEKGVPVVPPAFADTTTAYAVATGVCAALYHRALTGEGQKIETSLLANALTIHMGAFASIPAADAEEREAFYELIERARQEGLSYHEVMQAILQLNPTRQASNPYYRCYLTRDGAIAIGALSAELRGKVRATLGVEHNRDEPGYDPGDPKQREIDLAVVTKIEDLIACESSEYWERRFEAGGVPVSRVNFVLELIDHPQVVANEYVVEVEHDVTGPQRLAAPPWKMSATPPRVQSASPPLGRDTDAVLAQAGYSDAEIAKLRASGAIR
jgi:crotonobetainyl-CoA:carnitine CoA-transferase CaiB-like acyl-CoA transferase